MTHPSMEQIARFASKQYEYWNAGQYEELKAIYDEIAPNGFTIQYFGTEPAEGKAALQAMIQNVGGKVRTNVRQVLVNEGEAVVIIRNEVIGTDVSATSLERYVFGDGTVACSYFHDHDEAVKMGQALGRPH